MHRLANRLGAVGGDLQLDGRRDGAPQLGYDRFHALVGLDDVGAGLTANHEEHRPHAVRPRGHARVLHVVEHARHIPEPGRRGPVLGHDHVLERGGAEELIIGRYDVGLARAGERAFGRIDGGRGDGGAHVLEAQPETGQHLGVDLHAHRGLLSAADEDLPHPRDVGNFLREDGVCDVEDLRQRNGLAGQRQNDGRSVGRVHLPIVGPQRKVRRQLGPRRGDGGLDVAGRGVDVAVEIELERDRRRAERARRRDLGHAGDATEAPLERGRDRRGHGLRARAGERRVDLYGGELDARERRHGEEEERGDAGEQHGDREERGRNRPRDERRGDVHATPRGSCSLAAVVGAGAGRKRRASRSMAR
ncbi:MAG: hypothetical protein U0235_06410 [Polyangiaceae bacterium]